MTEPLTDAFPQSIHLVEDDPIVRRGSEQALRLAGFAVRGHPDAESLLDAIADGERPAVVVSDVRLPGRDGLALLRELLALDRALPVILVTGHGDVTMAVGAMRDGAYDFIEKPFTSERLVEQVRRALEKRRLAWENQRLRARLGEPLEQLLIGQNPAIVALRQTIAAVAPVGIDVLVNGETGCGKDVVARALHVASGRKGQFVALNCGALPENIFEAEVFGAEAGAYTGAAKRRIGKIEYADGGTLFLDEIESMPLALQVKLLRVIQDRKVERLGGNAAIAVDVRIVAASKADLKAESDAGRFRADLYHRLNVVVLDLPPLRERKDDIALLMGHFLFDAAQRFGRPAPGWSAGDLARWQAYDWPGNVRELKNVAERFCLGLPEGTPKLAGDIAPATLAVQVDRAEKRIIEGALRDTGGQVTRAAEALGLPRKTLYDKLARHGIDPDAFRQS
ncbi:sigma-54-dependent transcriptional regulator [Jeongeupia naejangsanensis]|uniref:Sigma-54-dependent Fis family transcriptional regulator n=1 Tax=Jeongeupia naejangsanensis TaxID=613195 RepID=A0ABS2BQ12_9NEIS|nr:sigma-54 dependent transcriptional regulator [Jeongeupia naejangsanensis]MBM3117658.1 sigma-54-dependent Fis family transcriptional regulator [Jeongeupia naejangsanensis]